MTSHVELETLDEPDQRLIAALQCDGRLTAERAATALNLSTRVVHRRWTALLGSGAVRVVAMAPRNGTQTAMLLRVKVLRGKLDTIAAALAAREDIQFIDMSASGDELSAILLAEAGHRNRLVFQQLSATSAITSVSAQTVLHVYSDATDWRLDVLTPAERAALAPSNTLNGPDKPDSPAGDLDPVDRDLAAALAPDARATATALAARTGYPESTVRRRLAALLRERKLITHVLVDPHRLGLAVDANLYLQIPPAHLDAAGCALARHPAVHGTLALTGPANLGIAVRLRDLEHLHTFITRDLARLEVSSVDTVLVGHAVKRPGSTPAGR